ncbi:hypothetical protein GBO31_01950 [Aquimarina litoralis]|nr:hypothetical protein [Aquimarina litoralis]
MKYIIVQKPYIIFWILTSLMLIYGFSFQEYTLDINIHDTYFVISWFHIFFFLSLSFLAIGLIYFAIHKLNKIKNSTLTYIHVVCTIGGLLVLTLLPYLFDSENNWKNMEKQFISQLIFLLIALIVQPILFVHLIISIFNKK